MKIKTSELTGAALDWAVAKCEGAEPLKRVEDHLTNGALPYCFDLIHDIKMYYEAVDILAGKPHCSGLGAQELRAFATEMGYVIDMPIYPAYSTDWSQGGPIIERERMTLEFLKWDELDGAIPVWLATKSERGSVCEAEGFSPLIAAMRCFVASKLGDEVDVPDELN